MSNKKLFILLPDGVGLRNFAFTSFVKLGEERGWDIVFWNKTPFDLNDHGIKQLILSGKPRALTDLLKRTKIDLELDLFSKKFDNAIFEDYKFSSSTKGLKNKTKNWIISSLSKIYSGESGISRLRKSLSKSERKGDYYLSCYATLQKERPDFVFCTNQRSLQAIAPLAAAKDLGIPTGSFIYSWDNIPKATLIVDPDNYFVWSEYMKKELQMFYPHISEERIFITGTPQFEPHHDESLIESRDVFYKKNRLDLSKDYICFSGDDVTTSPDDPEYLKDLADAVTALNKEGKNIGIIFRRCPVDFSDRYDKVLNEYRDIIVSLEPKWKKIGSAWNEILPTIEDQVFLINTIYHSKAVINLGSSMVFDFAIFNKPCLFINYDATFKNEKNWSTTKIYKFIHFKSMPDQKAVYWLNSKSEIQKKIIEAFVNPSEKVSLTQEWFQIINLSPASKSSERIWNTIENLECK